MGKTSEEITGFMDFIRSVESRYGQALEAVKTEEKRTQDLLHAIEFETQIEELTGLVTKLRSCRIERRENKDIVEELEPVMEYLEAPNHKKALDQLTQTLGKVRKAEKYHENRSYFPRVEKE